ncbi:MAG: hypothetical protein JWL80_84 [Parcubacteria group bacterium]|nr:hypothetical protein [Parcubacteria group bacterium]
MARPPKNNKQKRDMRFLFAVGGLVTLAALLAVVSFSNMFSVTYSPDSVKAEVQKALEVPLKQITQPLDKEEYDVRVLKNANNPVLKIATSTLSTSTPAVKTPWPVKTVYPNGGAILPFKRIVAYYGNFYSKGMGVLGEYPEDEMLSRLKAEVNVWNAADPNTPVVPAIHYIATTAQGSAGKQGFYMLRMPDSQIDHALELADKIDGIVFLDIQVGLSNLQRELPMLEKYLAMPNVHLGIDPEFSMKTGAKPGSVIGTMDAADINYAAEYLAKLVRDNNLPPKVLVIHRFTEDMLTNYKQIKPLPEVQIVVDMDGWGFGAKKLNTYQQVVYKEPVQFTGFKLFYKNDLKPPSTRLLTPQELLNLSPQPLYIQYQ